MSSFRSKILLIRREQRVHLWIIGTRLPRGTASFAGDRVSRMARRTASFRDLGSQGVTRMALQDDDDAEGREGPACTYRPVEPQLLGRRARPAVGRLTSRYVPLLGWLSRSSRSCSTAGAVGSLPSSMAPHM